MNHGGQENENRGPGFEHRHNASHESFWDWEHHYQEVSSSGYEKYKKAMERKEILNWYYDNYLKQ